MSIPKLLDSRDTEKALKPGRAPMPRPTAFTYASFSVHSRTKWRALSWPSAHPGTQHNESMNLHVQAPA